MLKKSQLQAIKEYRAELEKARDFYKEEKQFKDLDIINAELRGINEIVKILNIKTTLMSL